MRAYREVFDTDILELKKDVSYPGGYYRAGSTKSAKYWRDEFNISQYSLETDLGDWFINHTVILEHEKIKKQEPDLIRDEIDFIFKTLSLNSISYKDACRAVIDTLIKKKILIHEKS